MIDTISLQKKFMSLVEGGYSMDDFIKDYGSPPDILVDQKAPELKMLVDLYIQLRPKNIIEIGQYEGGTLYYWLKYAIEGSKILGLDIDHTRIGNKYTSWGVDCSNLQLLTSDSGDKKTFDIVGSAMPEVDFLFIDGYHYMPTVKTDFEWYGSLVKKGIVAFHDIKWPENSPEKGVGQVWCSISSNSENIVNSFISLPIEAPLCYGIGVYYKGF